MHPLAGTANVAEHASSRHPLAQQESHAQHFRSDSVEDLLPQVFIGCHHSGTVPLSRLLNQRRFFSWRAKARSILRG